MTGKIARLRPSLATQLLALAVALLVGILAGCGSVPTLESCDDVARATTRGGAESSSRGTLVQRVIDGDTVVLANGERVRYIGMDTPERGERLFDEATAYNRRLVEGQRVGLLKDQSEADWCGRGWPRPRGTSRTSSSLTALML